MTKEQNADDDAIVRDGEPWPRCEYPFQEGPNVTGERCAEPAEWRGWVKRSPWFINVCVCAAHQRELYGVVGQ